jgi:hypothetical protein
MALRSPLPNSDQLFEIVIACDKRKEFAQGSVSDEAIQHVIAWIQLDCSACARIPR